MEFTVHIPWTVVVGVTGGVLIFALDKSLSGLWRIFVRRIQTG